MGKKIAIYGGAFDPIHNGHIHIINTVLEKLDVEKIIIVPSKAGPWKQHFLTSGTHRMAMLEMVFTNNDKIEIDDFELKSYSISYSYKLLEYLTKKYPDNELLFIIGEDQVLNFKKWEKYRKILEQAQVFVSQRFAKNSQMDKINSICEELNFQKLNNSVIDVSSTYVRKGHFKNNVPLNVNKYIGDNALYLGNVLANNLSSYRFFHCLSVGAWAGKIADTQSDIDSKTAYIAGCLHDITKEWSFKKQYSYLQDMGLKYEKISIPVLHSFTGAFWVSDEYGITNKHILSSIIKHTTANETMSKFDKIIFIADKVCDDRDYPGVEEYRKSALIDIDKTFKQILIYQYKRTKKRQGRKHMNRRTIDAVAKYAFDHLFQKDDITKKE